MTQCGLFVEKKEGEECKPYPVPLTGVSVHVKIVDLVAQVDVEQHYCNREDQPVEAVYKFPLDEGAAVCRFTAEIDGFVIEGVVKETEKAREDYREATNSGIFAALVEETLPDVFKAKVGNIPPGSGAKIRISYVTELKVEGGEIRFYLPTTIAPRYVPPTDTSSAAHDLASIKYTSQSTYQVEFEADVKMGSTIKGIRSPTHTISVTNDGMKGAVKLNQVVTTMDRDLVLYVQIDEPNQPRMISEKSPKGTMAVMVSLVPSFRLAEQKTELIFVVDRSGSMQGAGIQQAKQALKLFLHSLPSDCYVNIVGFGSTYQLLFPASRKYGDEVLQLTKSHADSLEANLGGTEIFAPLENVLEQKAIDGYARQIFILTDGEVSNVDQVIALVRRQNARARFFALGLGSSASHYLVEGIARAGNGTALFASLEERLEKKVMQQLQDALQPSMTNIKVEWEGYGVAKQKEPEPPVQTEPTLMGFGKPIVQAPTPSEGSEKTQEPLRQAPRNDKIPPIFDGRQFVVYALLKEDAHVPQWAKVIADSPAGPLSLQIPLNPSVDESFVIHRLGAKKLIQSLQEEANPAEKAKEIVDLGCTYGLASRFTSYVAVDPREGKNDSWIAMKSRDVPVHLAHGWGGGQMSYASPPMMTLGPSRRSARCLASRPRMNKMESPVGAAPMARSCLGGAGGALSMMMADMRSLASPAESFDSLACDSIDLPKMKKSKSPMEHLKGIFSRSAKSQTGPEDGDAGEEEGRSPSPVTDDDKLMKLVSIQSFDGAFRVDSILPELLGTTLEDMTEAAKKCQADEKVWFTLVAVAYMALRLAHLQDSWRLVGDKAEKWLQSQNLSNLDSLKEAAQNYIKEKSSV